MRHGGIVKKDAVKDFFANKTVRIVLLCVAALLLLFAVWKVFFAADVDKTNGYAATEEEARLSTLLEKIDGVGEATVMVNRSDDGTKVVVVFDGTDGILTRLRITEVVSSAMNIPASSVLVCAVS